MARQVMMNGHPLNLLGKEIKVGDKAPDFQAIDKNMKEVKLANFKGKTVVINSVPSIDTPVCDMQVRRFNAEAAILKDVVILSISMDLPFALSRYCAAAGIDNVITTSDYKSHEFGLNYGLLIEELKLLSRAVIVIGKDGMVKYVEYVKEISNAPDFGKALQVIKTL